MPSHFSSIHEQAFLCLTDFFYSHPFLLGQGTVWYRNIMSGRSCRVFLQPSDFFHQLLFILGHGSWNLGLQRCIQLFFQTLPRQCLFHPWVHPSFKSGVSRCVHTAKRVAVCISGTGGGKVQGGESLVSRSSQSLYRRLKAKFAH